MPNDSDSKKKALLYTTGAMLATASAGAAAYWLTSDKDTKKFGDLSNAEVLRQKVLLFAALQRLKGYDPAKADIPMTTGLHRVAYPKKAFSIEGLVAAGGVPSVVAVPEKGQVSPITFRLPETNLHVHEHPSWWTIHKDRHTPLSMTKRDKSATKAEGWKHILTEGIPGFYENYKTRNTGKPFEDTMNWKLRQKHQDSVFAKLGLY